MRAPLSPLLLCLALGACPPPAHAPTTPSPEPASPPVTAAPPEPAPVAGPRPLRIAFGSCNDLDRPQKLWGHIAALEPDLWIWLGDNIYADTTDMAKMQLLYDRTKAEPGYARLRKLTRVVGTWDDHDYGHNDAGKEYPKRKEAQRLLLDFLDEPQGSPRRAQKGVYASYDIGTGPRSLRVIVLDTRYHRDPPGPNADVLGEAQWAWLQDQLAGSPAAVNVVVSSIQLVATTHPHEKWANFPAARQRMLALIGASGARNVVVISGDRHYAELSRAPVGSDDTMLYDLTSSSLSRPWDEDPKEANPDRVGDYYWHVNFGLLELDWAAGELRMQVHGEDGQPKIQHSIALEPVSDGF